MACIAALMSLEARPSFRWDLIINSITIIMNSIINTSIIHYYDDDDDDY